MPWPCEQRTPPTFSWIGENLTGTLGPKTPRSSVLTITPQPQDHGTNLTCQVTFPGAAVTVHKTVQLNVSCECQPACLEPGEERDRGSRTWGGRKEDP